MLLGFKKSLLLRQPVSFKLNVHSFKEKKVVTFVYVHWYFASMYVYVSVSDLGVTHNCKLPCGCWGPVEEQSVPLAVEPSLQPPSK